VIIWRVFRSSHFGAGSFLRLCSWLALQALNIGSVSLVNRFGKVCFSCGQQVFESISFWSVKVGFWLFGVLTKYSFHSASESLNRFCFGWSRLLIIWRFSKSVFLVVAKVKVMCKNVCQFGGGIFFQPMSLQVLPHLTKRAADGGESARFTSIFLASGFFYISDIFQARPTTANATRWVAVCQYKIRVEKLCIKLR